MLGRLRRRAPVEEERGTFYPQWIPALAGTSWSSSSGEVVSTTRALQHPAVWACSHRIARDVSRLPWDVVRYQGDARIAITPTPRIVAEPSVSVPASGWRYQAIMSLLLRGNVWGRVTETDQRMVYPTRIELIHPDDVRVDSSSGRFYVKQEEAWRWPVGDLWHVPAWLMPGSPIGLSVVEYHRETIGSGLAVQRYAAEFYGGGGHPSAIIGAKSPLNQEQADAIKASWRRATMGSREPAVMGSDLEYKPIQTTPEDAQYVEAQRWSSEEVCRIFGVPPEMIGISPSGSSLTYATREDRALDYVTYTLADWLTRLEEALTAALPKPQVVKANPNALLRMNAKGRAEVHEIGLRNGWRSVNEVRALEDEPPIEGGDVYAVVGSGATNEDQDGSPDD